MEKPTVWNLFKYRKAAALTTAMRSVKEKWPREPLESYVSTKKQLHLTLLRGIEDPSEEARHAILECYKGVLFNEDDKWNSVYLFTKDKEEAKVDRSIIHLCNDYRTIIARIRVALSVLVAFLLLSLITYIPYLVYIGLAALWSGVEIVMPNTPLIGVFLLQWCSGAFVIFLSVIVVGGIVIISKFFYRAGNDLVEEIEKKIFYEP